MNKPLQLTDNSLLATVNINGLNPYYQSSDNITLIQSYNATPIITYISPTSTIPGAYNMNQSTNFYIRGLRLLSTILADDTLYKSVIKIGSITCSFDEDSATEIYLNITCLNMAAGYHVIDLNSPVYGDAVSKYNDTMNVPLLILNADFDIDRGSVAGGTRFTVSGAGFQSSSCAGNTATFKLSNGYVVPITLSECNTYSIGKPYHDASIIIWLAIAVDFIFVQ